MVDRLRKQGQYRPMSLIEHLMNHVADQDLRRPSSTVEAWILEMKVYRKGQIIISPD
jgi:hypothetical protein